ncbi:MAG: DUF4199 domain-containing protein [Fulvivirga sp.]
MEESNEKGAALEDGAKAGVIIAAINILLTVIMYVIDPTIMANWWVGLLILALFFILVVVYGIKYRKSLGGYLAFGKAYLHGLSALVVALLVGMIFNILLYTVIDPDLAGVITDASIEKTSEMMRNMGAPDDAIDEALGKMEQDMPARFTLLGFVKQFGIGIIVSAIVALITGLIVKKNKPIEDF